MARLSPLVKALRLAIKDLERTNNEFYAHSKDAARYGFEFGVHAKIHYDEHIEAIEILKELLRQEIIKTHIGQREV